MMSCSHPRKEARNKSSADTYPREIFSLYDDYTTTILHDLLSASQGHATKGTVSRGFFSIREIIKSHLRKSNSLYKMKRNKRKSDNSLTKK
jgi:hypothetical protein